MTLFTLSIAAALAAAQTAVPLQNLRTIEILPLQARLHHVQGIAIEGDRLWISSVQAKAGKGYLSLVELPSGRLLAEVEVQEGARVHPGGISIYGETLWMPVAEYHRGGSTTIQQRDKNTLRLVRSFRVEDHIGCVAAGRDWIAGGNWDSLQIYFWDRQGRLLRKVDNPTGNRYQDLKVVDGKLAGGGKLNAEQGAIDWLDPDSLHLLRRITTGKTDRGVLFTNEGMTIVGNRLYLLPEDGPSRLFAFELTADFANSAFSGAGEAGWRAVSALPGFVPAGGR